MVDEEEEPLTPGHYFQTLDRAHIAARYLQSVFEADPVLLRHPELRELFEAAVDRLERLYQAVGQYDIQ